MSDVTIQANDARMTIIGKNWPDVPSTSGSGDWDNTYDGTYDGEIPRNDLPAKIEVITPPRKIEYYQYELLNLTGLVVKAYDQDGNLWTSLSYPDGVIPIEELVPTSKVAVGEGFIKQSDLGITVKSKDYLDRPDFPIKTWGSITRWSNQQHTGSPYTNPFSYETGPVVPTFPGNDGYNRPQTGFLLAQAVNAGTETYEEIRCWIGINSTVYTRDIDEGFRHANFYTHHRKCLNYKGGYSVGARNLNIIDHSRNIYEELIFNSNLEPLTINYPYDLSDFDTRIYVLWTMVFGDVASAYGTVTLTWARPEDGEKLETSFDISVLDVVPQNGGT